MAKKLFIMCILMPLLICTNSVFAQPTNSNEDYSAYLPEAIAMGSYVVETIIKNVKGSKWITDEAELNVSLKLPMAEKFGQYKK